MSWNQERLEICDDPEATEDVAELLDFSDAMARARRGHMEKDGNTMKNTGIGKCPIYLMVG